MAYSFLFWFWYEGNLCLMEWVRRFYLLAYFFGRVPEELVLILSEIIGVIHQCIYLILDFSLWKIFKWLIQYLYLLYLYSDYLFILESTLVICVFLEISPFRLDYLFVVIQLFRLFSYILSISVILIVMPSLHFILQ